jgi:integrase
MRTDELARLWRDVDLVHNRVKLDINKTDDPRDWDMQPGTLAALRIWKSKFCPEAAEDDAVFAEGGVPLNVEHLADQLRRDLRRIGVHRAELYERSEVRQPIRAHDLRATFVTVSLANGKSERWVKDRTGHRNDMVETYRRRARIWCAQVQGDLVPLHQAIPELRSAHWTANGPQLHRTGGEIGRRSGFRFRAGPARIRGRRQNKPDRRSEITRNHP